MPRTKGALNRPKDKSMDSNVTGLAKPKKEKKEVLRTYEYTPLASTSLGATSLYNLYGVVIDA